MNLNLLEKINLLQDNRLHQLEYFKPELFLFYMLPRRHPRRWVKYSSIIVQSKKSFNKYRICKKSRKFLWHFFLFAVSKTYRTVTPLYRIEPNCEFCEPLHPYTHTPCIPLLSIFKVKSLSSCLLCLINTEHKE